MHLELPEQVLSAKVVLDPESMLTDDEYYEFCMANPHLNLERTAEGEIVIAPPAGGESDYQSASVIGELRNWAKRDRRGKTFGSTVQFILPTRAALSPDSAWVSKERLKKLSVQLRRKFLPVCPEFVVEVISPSDRLPVARRKMEEWRRGGVELGWLIDAAKKTVYIYRKGRTEPEKRIGLAKLAGEGPVAGFELDLEEIWEGLNF